jgi:hypothetical protein
MKRKLKNSGKNTQDTSLKFRENSKHSEVYRRSILATRLLLTHPQDYSLSLVILASIACLTVIEWWLLG